MLRLVLLASMLWIVASPAQAWTRAQVRTADAELALTSQGALQVGIELGVEVSGGWLERLEVPGLPVLPDTADHIEASWAVAQAEQGGIGDPHEQEAKPSVRLQDGRLALLFERGQAPRRGHHRLSIRYELLAIPPEGWAADAPGHALEWTMPGFESGLERASVTWLLPQGARARANVEEAEQITSTQLSDGRSRVSFERVHVPRETPWRVAVELPKRSAAPSESQTGSKVGLGSLARAEWPFIASMLCVIAIGLIGRAHARRWGRRQGVPLRSLWLRRERFLPWLTVGFVALVLGARVAGWRGLSLLGIAGLSAVFLQVVEASREDARTRPSSQSRDSRSPA